MMDSIASFFDSYGEREWERLERTAYGRLIFNCHMWFLENDIGPGRRVLDAGCGSGRFALPAALSGSDVTLLDISQTQLDIAEQKLYENNCTGKFVAASITDMSIFPDDTFDTVICYGAVLNYLRHSLINALRELRRVLRPGGALLISVNSRYGMLRSAAASPPMPLSDLFGDPDRWGIREIADTGDENMPIDSSHPPRHFFTASELTALLQETKFCEITLGAAPAAMSGLKRQMEEIARNQKAWETVLYTENCLYKTPHIADCGDYILARATK